MTPAPFFIIDDRRTQDFSTPLGKAWYLVTDTVMGGLSQAQLSSDCIAGHQCLRMRGDVTLENNGGFVQIALNLTGDATQNIKAYAGIRLDIYGNGEQYNVHLRTTDLAHPWQSYRTSFLATPAWQTLYLPFSAFKPHRTDVALNLENLKRIGLVAIGRAFHADLAIARVAWHADDTDKRHEQVAST